MTDKDLYLECKKFGAESLAARWKFIGLLPEVMRREMKSRVRGKSWLERRGYKGINMFAAKLAGVSEEQVKLVLSLDKRFEYLPLLRKVLTNGDVSINKLSRIASIATNNNQKELIQKMKILSNRALELFIKMYKNEVPDGLQIKNFNVMSMHVQKPNAIIDHHARKQTAFIDVTVKSASTELEYTKFGEHTREAIVDMSMLNYKSGPPPKQLPKITTLQLDKDIEAQLLELQEKGININGLLRQFLKQRKERIDQKLEEVAEQLPQATDSRYRPVPVEEVLYEKFGIHCGEPDCKYPATEVHHEKPFAKYKTHDPRHLKPLCKAHHELAHHQDALVQKFRC